MTQEPTEEQVKHAEDFFSLFDSDATIPVATQDRAWAYAHGKVLAQAFRREREKVKELEAQLSQAQRTERETAIVDELVTIYTDKAKDLLAIIVKKDAALRAIQGTCADDCDVHSECDVIQKALSLTPEKARKIREAEHRVIEAAQSRVRFLNDLSLAKQTGEGEYSYKELEEIRIESNEKLLIAIYALDELRKT